MSLPKLENRSHSSLCGALSNYQSKLTEKFLCIIGKLQSQINTISKQTISKLDCRMKQFINQKDKLVYDQHQIIESISTTDEQFETLRQKLTTNKESILNEFDLCKDDSLQIYDNSYQHITRSINESYQSSKEIINMIPSAISDRLQNEVTKINSDYINTKRSLIKSIYLMKSNILCQQSSIFEEFEEKKESWNSNRFRLLIKRAKNIFYPISPINYDSLYHDFHTDQQKFTNCFKKSITDISLIIPPDQFTNEALKKWWCELEEFLKYHETFINHFSNQFQTKLNQNIEENGKILSDLETELFELTKNMNTSNNEESRNVSLVIDELTNLCRMNEKANLQFVTKIQSYFAYSHDCLLKSFESIRDFYQKMIDSHQNCISSLNEREEIENKEITDIEKVTKSEIEKLESEIQDSKDKINLMVSNSEIDHEIDHCKKILSKIEEENRNYFNKVLKIYEDQPSKVSQIFESSEKVVLDLLNLKKVTEPKTSSNGKKPSRSKNQSLKKGGKEKLPTPESFKIECGIEFESSGPLSIIPTFSDFSSSFQLINEKVSSKSDKNEKGKKSGTSRKNLAKSPSRGSRSLSKSGKDQKQSILGLVDFNESEIPNFELTEIIPKIDDKIAILIPLPTMDDLDEWLTQFKIIYMNFFYELFESHMKKSKNEVNKEKLTNELNESLRVLHPRFASIEVNFAEARKIKISSQKDQLDLYFKRISKQFNSLVSKFKTNYDNDENEIISEVEKLQIFTDDLKNQKNGRSLAFHGENFKHADKSCQSKIDNFLNRQEKAITDFFNFFKTKNDRFKTVCLNQKEGIYSEEETKMALIYFENMDKQMSEIQKTLKLNFQTTKKKIESLHKEIVKKFELSFQFHSIDVKFIDENSSIQTEFMHKIDSLKSQNNRQQNEIQKALDEIELILNKSIENNSIENHSNEINLILNCLEFLRMKILNRSIFLGQLKSDIQIDSIVFTIDLNENNHLKKMQQINNEPIIKKSSSSKVKNSKSKTSSKNQKNQNDQDKKVKNQNEQSQSFLNQIESLKSEFISRLTKISVDYYNQFKTRKFEITRPNEIPQNQADYLNKISGFWSNLTDSKSSILNESILKFRFQVSSALNKAKDVEKVIYKIFIDFCNKKIENKLEIVNRDIEKELNGLREESDKNLSMINLKISDENNSSQLELLIESEQKRAKNESEFISKSKTKILEIEKNCVKNFLNNLEFLTSLSLSLFDKFVLIEDLIAGPIAENEKRKTLKELKKNQIRLLNLNATVYNNNKRPFAYREWPKENSTLKIMSQFGFSNEGDILLDDLNDVENNINNDISNDLKNKRRKSKNIGNDSLQNDHQKESLRPDSTKQSGRKQKDFKNKKNKNSENDENELKSFDTPIHRYVIIEKNKVLSEFNEKLDKRAKKFNEFFNSLILEEEDIQNYWQKTIPLLKPNFSLPKLEMSSNI